MAASKKSKNRGQPRTNRPAQRAAAPRQRLTAASLGKDIDAGAATATDALGGEPLPAPPADEEPVTDLAAVAELWRKARQAQLAFEGLTSDLTEREQAVSGNEDRQAQRLAELDEREAAVQEREAANGTRTEALDNREQTLIEQVRDLIIERERGKEQMLAELRSDLASMQQQYGEQRRTFDKELVTARARLTEELNAQRGELDKQRADLTTERAQLREQKHELATQAEDLADTKALYEERLKRAVDAATEEWRLRCQHLEESHERARNHADRLEAQAAARQELDRAFGHRDAAMVLEELEQLRADRAELHRLRLAGVDDDLANQLAAVIEERDRLQERYDTLAATHAQLQRQQAAYQMDMATLERLKLTADGWRATAGAYEQAVADLTERHNELVRRQSTAQPFPACAKLDEKYDDEFDQLPERAPALPELISQVREFIAKQHQLFYTEDDLRCVLAGLAASRLHLLEGISGIGKTQLPQRFAEAIGAEAAVVSVGADWRTPQDLMGYYNAFEKRFYESEFTQALYRAQCPWYESRPFLLVLDEMNLSHPEQYFNDVLSALEKDVGRSARPELVLMTAGVEPRPRHLIDGRKLAIPPNVWFLGTANQDETTVSFADKTYDRAHVMQLPDRPERFHASATHPVGPLGKAVLDKAFQTARKAHATETGHVRDFLNNLRKRMSQELRLSWGARLHRQLGNFVPVYVAAGGSVSDAADHLLATKILRKLRGRYEIRFDLLRQLRRDLPGLWEQLDNAGHPRKSLHLLDEEIHKRGES